MVQPDNTFKLWFAAFLIINTDLKSEKIIKNINLWAMEIKLGMDDVVNVGKNNKITVSELVPVKGEIFNLIKKGFEFDDEVLEKAHIKKIIRDIQFKNVVVMHEQEKNRNKYVKETESLKSILKSLNTLDNPTEETYNVDENKTVSEE